MDSLTNHLWSAYVEYNAIWSSYFLSCTESRANHPLNANWVSHYDWFISDYHLSSHSSIQIKLIRTTSELIQIIYSKDITTTTCIVRNFRLRITQSKNTRTMRPAIGNRLKFCIANHGFAGQRNCIYSMMCHWLEEKKCINMVSVCSRP